jgi:hypothetical protein
MLDQNLKIKKRIMMQLTSPLPHPKILSKVKKGDGRKP